MSNPCSPPSPHPQKNTDILIAVFSEANNTFDSEWGTTLPQRLKFNPPTSRPALIYTSGVLWTPPCQAHLSPASPAPGTRRSPDPCQARKLQRRRKGERGGAPSGGGPETQVCGRKIPVPPNLSSARGQTGPARRAGEGKAPTLQSRQDQGPERTTCPCLSPESSRVCPTKGGREAPETFPHAFPLSPSPSPLPRPMLPSAPQQLARLGTRGGRRRRQGGGSYLRESFQLLGAVTHPQGRASGRGQLSAPRLPLLRLPRRPLLLQQPLLRLRSGPSPRLAQPTPGPHWQRESPPLRVFPKAPSSRAPARAAPPASLPAPGCGGSRNQWDAARELSAGTLASLRGPSPRGCVWALPGLDQNG